MMNHPDDVRHNNPYNLTGTLNGLRFYLSATGQTDGLNLLEKAVLKTSEDTDFSRQFVMTFKYGSTLAIRDLFSHFGDYGEKPRSSFPFYPHVDAVNAIDTAFHKVKLGLDLEAEAAEYNGLHNHNRDS